MALRDELLYPFQGAGQAGRDLLAGSAVLAGRACRCLGRSVRALWHASTKGDSFVDRAESFGVAVLVGAVALAAAGTGGVALVWVGGPYLSLAARAALGVGAVGWVVTALIVAPASGRRKAAAAPSKPHAELLSEEAMDNHRANVLAWVRLAIGDRNGIHLSELLGQAHSQNLMTHLELGDLRTLLDRCQIPVRQQLKVGGRNRPGIHRDDLPPEPALLPSPIAAQEVDVTHLPAA